MSTRVLMNFFAALASAFALCWGLGAYPLLQPDEGRNAEIAREMLQSGSWLIPTYNGLPYLDKPAFFFRAVASSLALFGENEAAARLPSALFGLATIGLIFAFCRRHYGATTAAAAALILATTPLYFAFARVVIFDMTLGFFVSATVLACFTAAEESCARRRAFYVLGAAMAGLATLVKGPVGFLVPTIILASFHAWTGNRGWWRDAFLPRNILVFLAIVGPWFIGTSLHHPDFPYYGLVKESFQRFTTSEFRRTAPFYYYAIVIALCFFPWSLFLPGAVARTWRWRASWRPVDRLFVAWTLAVVAFFSLSQSKLPGYILTVAVALSVLVARVIVSAHQRSDLSLLRGVVRYAALSFALIALPAALLCLLPSLDPDTVAATVPRSARYLESLAPALLRLARLFALTGALSLIAFLRDSVPLTAATFSGFGFVLIPLLTGNMHLYAEHRSAATLAQRMPPLSDDTMVVCCRCYPNGYSFYSKKSVVVVSAADGYELQSNYIRFALQQSEKWPTSMIREREFPTWREHVNQPMFLLARNVDLERCRALLEQRDIFFTRLTAEYAGTLLPPARQD